MRWVKAASSSKLLSWLLLGCCPGSLSAAVLPSGTILEIRLLTPVSSHDARRSDLVRGITVVPLRDSAGALILPVGTIVQGHVERAKRVGLGLVHETASLRIQFDEIVPDADGPAERMATHLVSVDNAREKVDRAGTIHGIRATASMAHRLHRRALHLIAWHPIVGLAAAVSANVLFKFPEPEIVYLPGTELHARLERDLTLEAVSGNENEAANLTTAEGTRYADAIGRMPEWTHRPKSFQAIDPTNLLFIGDRGRLERAFAAAGWDDADRISNRSRLQSIRAVAESRAYLDAPMSPMQLAGRTPDLLRQRGLNTFTKRHHVRIWQQPEMVDGEQAWLGAATHDTSVCPTFKPLGFSHHIEADVDLERQKVLHDLILTGCVAAHGVVDRASSEMPAPLAAKHLTTDEAVVVIRLNECRSPRPLPDDESVKMARPNWGTRLTRRVTLTARNYALRENLAFRIYDMGRVAWFLTGKAGRPKQESLPQRTFTAAERFAIPTARVGQE
ncbi:MAG: LssY C-terminal domain-containing protein [Bryobacteraceae bacterium]|nr:LssY C-terminal domain-containing protein [Bryobacteraceae bacterium]